ncbi:MAG: SGNH/GDSL hydrolase family protein [Planctomycetota bacterium]
MRAEIGTTVVLLAAALGARAQAPEARPPTRAGLFPDGGVTVWVGDSITHGCLYTRFLEDFARSRHPARRLRFINAGVSADTAREALLRFDEDVAPWKPAEVFVCLGMNDGGFVAWDAARFAAFKEHMGLILDRVAALGAKARLLSPPPIDAPAWDRGPLASRVHGADYGLVLTRYAEWLEDEAGRRGAAWVDLLSPLREAGKRLRLENPGASLSPDGIHPNEPGAALMALEILARSGELAPRGEVVLPARGEARCAGGSLDGVERGADRVAFRLRADCLPWVLPLEARGAAVLDPRYVEANRLTLGVEGLADGVWELSVDGTRLLAATARAWARGVDVGSEVRHPDWLQSALLTRENAERSRQIVDGIRDLFLARRAEERMRSEEGVDSEAHARARARVLELREGLVELGRRMLRSDQWLDRARRTLPRRYVLERR